MTTTNTCTLACTSNLDGHCIEWPRVQNCKRWRENEPIVSGISSLPPFSVMMEEVTAMESLEVKSSRAKELAEAHIKYTVGMLKVCGVAQELIAIVEHTYREAWMHAWKHCEEEENESRG